MFVTLAMVVGVDSMAPVNSIQAGWLDVKDFGCVGVNNYNTETCTDTSAAETSVDQTSINNTGDSTCQISSTDFDPQLHLSHVQPVKQKSTKPMLFHQQQKNNLHITPTFFIFL